MAKQTQGTELMRQLNDGRLEPVPSEFLAKSREEISTAIEELLDVGARIRPLFVGNRQTGWVRGVHLSERKALKRWVYNEIDFVKHLLRLGTTLTDAEIHDLSLVELRSLSRVVRAMTESDLKLFPYLNAFVSTGMSEQLWYAKGTEVTSFRDRWVDLPDGKRMKIMAAAEQARLWASLCNYRIQNKARLDASFNAVLMIRPWVGKGADPLSAELKSIARGLQTDSFEPWREVIQLKPETNFDDGWAHSLGDDSIEGMKRELNGMVNNDRHERAVALFEKQENDRALKKKQELEERIAKKQAEIAEPTKMVIRTEAEVRAIAAAQQEQRAKLKPIVHEETQSSVADRLAKYK